MTELNKLRTQLIEKNIELEHMRNQLSELQIRYDALRIVYGDFSNYNPVDDAQVQRDAASQALSMGKVFEK